MFECTVNMDKFSERIKQIPMVDKRITTEQLLQLCRILAEQSKKKSFQNDDVSNSEEIQSEDISSSRPSEHDICDRLSEGLEEHQKHHQQSAILADSNCNKYFSVSVMKTKQAKRDILNKIRNQIFERKRQKLARMQRSIGTVWRPW